MVTLFMLDEDYRKSAEAACDQHIVKIPTEIVQSAWVVASVFGSEIVARARAQRVKFKEPKINYHKRHMQTLPRWMALCRGNFMEALARAAAMTAEYTHRYKKMHPKVPELAWLMQNAIDFNSVDWLKWYEREHRGVDTKKKLYVDWFAAYGKFEGNPVALEGKSGVLEGDKKQIANEPVWEAADRNEVGRTTPFPQIMDDDVFVGCRTPNNPVAAGKKHYVMKARGIGMKERMRYFYRPPPAWLKQEGVILKLHRSVRAKALTSLTTCVEPACGPLRGKVFG
jgi:hypothetical protein